MEERLTYREAYALTVLRDDSFETYAQSLKPAP